VTGMDWVYSEDPAYESEEEVCYSGERQGRSTAADSEARPREGVGFAAVGECRRGSRAAAAPVLQIAGGCTWVAGQGAAAARATRLTLAWCLTGAWGGGRWRTLGRSLPARRSIELRSAYCVTWPLVGLCPGSAGARLGAPSLEWCGSTTLSPTDRCGRFRHAGAW
jgi:hypothetical protein